MKRWTPISRSPLREVFRRGGLFPAPPLSTAYRRQHYEAQNKGRPLTPRQRRRIRHKENHAVAVVTR